MNRDAGDTTFPIGHSTRTLAEFVTLVRQVDVTLVVDVSSMARSKTTPQFNDTLSDTLTQEGVGYPHPRVMMRAPRSSIVGTIWPGATKEVLRYSGPKYPEARANGD